MSPFFLALSPLRRVVVLSRASEQSRGSDGWGVAVFDGGVIKPPGKKE